MAAFLLKEAFPALGGGSYGKLEAPRTELAAGSPKPTIPYHSIRCEQRPGGFALVTERLGAEWLPVRRETRQYLAARGGGE